MADGSKLVLGAAVEGSWAAGKVTLVRVRVRVSDP